MLRQLKPRDQIGLLTPAGAVQPEQVEGGIRFLQEMGFDCQFASHAFDKGKLSAGTAANRLQDLHQFLDDPEIAVIWAMRGGYGSMQLLEALSCDKLWQSRKPIVGFSDLTALEWGMVSKCAYPSFSGLTITSQLHNDNPYAELGVEMLLGKQKELPQLPVNCVRKGSAEGVLMGGTLSMICSLCGTPYFPVSKPIILFLEDVNEPLYRIDRCFQQLAMTGFWKQVRGVLIGEFLWEDRLLSIEELLLEYVSPDCPVVSGLPYGHRSTTLLMPVGFPARFSASPFRLNWEYPEKVG